MLHYYTITDQERVDIYSGVILVSSRFKNLKKIKSVSFSIFLFSGSFKFYENSTDVESQAEKSEGKGEKSEGKEEKGKERKRTRKRNKDDRNSEDSDGPGPSSASTPAKKNKKPSFCKSLNYSRPKFAGVLCLYDMCLLLFSPFLSNSCEERRKSRDLDVSFI